MSASLSLAAVACVNRLLHRDLSPDLTVFRMSKRGRAVVLSVAFCAVILLNPAIKWVHFWSALADPAIAVVVLVTIATWCRLLVDAQATCPSTSDSAETCCMAFDLRSAEVPTFFLLGVLIAGTRSTAAGRRPLSSCLLACSLASLTAFRRTGGFFLGGRACGQCRLDCNLETVPPDLPSGRGPVLRASLQCLAVRHVGFAVARILGRCGYVPLVLRAATARNCGRSRPTRAAINEAYASWADV